MSRAGNSLCMKASAAACAKPPPEPMAIKSCSGSITSPVPDIDISAFEVGDAQQGLEAAQTAVGAPILGQLDRSARQVAEFLQFALEALEQGKRIGGAAGKSRQHLSAVQAPHLARIGLHHAVVPRSPDHRRRPRRGHCAAPPEWSCHKCDRDRESYEPKGGAASGPFKRCEVGAGLADGPHRRRWPNAGNPGACRPGWC